MEIVFVFPDMLDEDLEALAYKIQRRRGTETEWRDVTASLANRITLQGLLTRPKWQYRIIAVDELE